MLNNDLCKIPEMTYQCLVLYVTERCPVGGFLEAVLMNRLCEAFQLADIENKENLENIVRFVYNEMPAKCWGSPREVMLWLSGEEEKGE